MKKFLTLFSIIFLIAFISTSAQPFKLAIFTGYGQSAFENSTSSAGSIPLGLQASYGFENMNWGAVTAGLEFNYAVVPFTFEQQGTINNQPAKLNDQKFNQMIIAALVKVKFLKKKPFNPFIRVGGGMYTGNVTYEWTDAAKQAAQQAGQTLQDELKLKSGFGFNIGAGADYNISKAGALFLEFVYHIISREADVQGAQSSGLNNWAIQVGYQQALGN